MESTKIPNHIIYKNLHQCKINLKCKRNDYRFVLFFFFCSIYMQTCKTVGFVNSHKIFSKKQAKLESQLENRNKTTLYQPPQGISRRHRLASCFLQNHTVTWLLAVFPTGTYSPEKRNNASLCRSAKLYLFFDANDKTKELAITPNFKIVTSWQSI